MDWESERSEQLPIVLERLKDLVDRLSTMAARGERSDRTLEGGEQVELGDVSLETTDTSLVPCGTPDSETGCFPTPHWEGAVEGTGEWWALPTVLDVEAHLGRRGIRPLTRSQRRRMQHRDRRERWLRASQRSETPYPVQRVLCGLGVAPRQPFSSKYMYGLDRRSPVSTLVTVDSDGGRKPYEMHTYLGDDRWEVELLA